MPLKKYQQKRSFEKTPEPKGKVTQSKKMIYIIQKHAASHLHYDLRLAWKGVLKSWAVPKGPSYNPKEKRLAVEVEDHPMNYASFEGIIPQGEYGGGTVMLWDKGTWEPINDPAEGFAKGKLEFRLHGDKLKGIWALVRMQLKGSKPNWLLIKKTDEYANSIDDKKLLETPSVKTGRDLDDIAGKAKTTKKKAPTKQANLTSLDGAVKKKMPEKFSPQLATLVKTHPQGPHWLYEIKFDGYRLLAFIHARKVKLLTRNGHDWTEKFPQLAQSLAKLPVKSAIIDGELVAVDKKGVSKFQLLQNALDLGDAAKLGYYAFDLPYCDGYDLTHVALKDRKLQLKEILKQNTSDTIVFSDSLEGDAKTLLKKACKQGLEGLIAKDENSSYLNKRTQDWAKLKCVHGQEFVIAGFTDPAGKREYFGSLLLGYYDNKGNLKYAGKVGTGFTQKTLKDIYQKMHPLIQTKTSFYQLPKLSELKHAHWIKPKLVGELEFIEWTQDNRIRHPAFKGLRADKKATEVHRENPLAKEKTKVTAIKKKSEKVGDVALSHPEKVYYPKLNLTKADLAEYYHTNCDLILPHIINRPLAIVRCPEGVDKTCFYQKHIETLPKILGKVKVKEENVVREHIVVKNEEGLIALIQHGTLEFHTWGCLADDIEKPDRIIFDIDPGPEVSFAKVIECATILRAGLEGFNLQSFVKTSGKKGLHICIPLIRGKSWEETRRFAAMLADHLVNLAPEQFTTNMSKAGRQHKILIDYLRNRRGATCVAAFSTRATLDATVSVPLHWNELKTLKSAAQFTVLNIQQRIQKIKCDPWREYFTLKQSLPDNF